jgi:mRNA interferase MazF
MIRAIPAKSGAYVGPGDGAGLILLDQVRAVDKTRLAKRLGAVSAKALIATLSTLQEVFTE